MSDTKITSADLEAILKLVQSAEHLGDFHLKYGDLELHVSRPGGGEGAAPPPPAAASPAPRAAAAGSPTRAPEPARVEPASPKLRTAPAGMAVVKAPMVGTFYRAPAPGAKPFVEVGDRVTADSVVCIIEVMKLMNTIHAEVSGIVREIPVENSEPVEFGQILLVIEPDGLTGAKK